MPSIAQGPRSPAISALRSARAEVVAELLAQNGAPTWLSDLYARMRFRGLTKAQADRAVDDLAATGRATVTASVYGGLVIRLGGGV